MELDRSTGLTLRYGVYLSMAIMVIGLVLMQIGADIGASILNAGIAVLVFTPFVSIMVSTLALYTERDWEWLRVALTVLAITACGIVVALLT